MNMQNDAESFGWLKATLAAQRIGMHQLLSRLRQSVKTEGAPSIDKKFARLMDQVANEQKKEVSILNQIEAIERKHKALKQENLLQRLALHAQLKRQKLQKEMEEDHAFWLNRAYLENKSDSPNALNLLIMLYLVSSITRTFFRFITFKGSDRQKPTIH
jgi:hypothetical protein